LFPPSRQVGGYPDEVKEVKEWKGARIMNQHHGFLNRRVERRVKGE
jgi:hypothetical protein